MLFDRLASRVFGSDASCISPDDLARNTLGQPNLWGYGISGDLPIVLVRVTEADVAAARAPAAARAGVLARQGPARRRRHPQRASGGLSRRDAGLPDAASCRSRAGRAGSTSRAACSCCAPTACRRPIAVCSPRSRASSCAATSAIWRRSSIARRRGCTPGTTSPPSAELPRAGAGADAGRGAAARHGERPRRLHARRPRVRRRARRRSRDAAAVVERAGEPRVRHDRQRSGSAFTWAGNSRENRLTPFANDPIDRSDRRSDLPARRGLGRGVGRHAGAAAAPGRRRPLGRPSRAPASRAISTPSPGSSRSWRSSSRRTIR